MKFTKIKKRKVLETWQHKNRELGLVSFIYYDPYGYYYFAIACFGKRCGLQECNKNNCDKYVYYNSLEQGLWYESFDDCSKAVNKWYRIWS